MSAAPKIPVAIDDSAFITPFLEATIKTLDVQCGLEARVGDPLPAGAEIIGIALTSILNLETPGYHGRVLLAFSEVVFLKICSAMFGEPITEFSNENREAAAELLNMVYGHAKVELNSAGFEFPRAFPRVREQATIRRAEFTSTATLVPIETSVGTFHISLKLNRTNSSSGQ